MFALHNYAESPYAEKIRAMLGYSKLPWHSVDVPPQPPRPSLDPLLGGYRRIPVLQDGADIICDTHLIADEIARRTDMPELSPLNADEEATAFMDKVEGDLFFAAILCAPKGKMLLGMVMRRGFGLFAFMKDRMAASREGGVGDFGGSTPKELWAAHLGDMEQRLQGTQFLAGDKPDIRDFAAYHTVWINSVLAGGDIGGNSSHLAQWRDRIGAFGHGAVTQMSVKQALAAAKEAQPQAIGEDMKVAEKSVAIAPADYMRAPTEGLLVAEAPSKWIIARDTADHGRVHVHFPKKGYVLTEA